jgi:predicted nucleic acid-binding protein
MNVVDSSGWLEYFAEGPNGPHFATAIRNLDSLLVPTIAIYEVFKRVRLQTGDAEALTAVTFMMEATVVELTTELAIEAARISSDHHLPTADSIMWTTAQFYEATFWTQDADFAELPGVNYISKPSPE